MASGSKDAGELAIDLLREDREKYSFILGLFQENHELSWTSGFFPRSITSKIDQCAISFRSLGNHTVSLADVISDQWLESVLDFYNHMDQNSHSDNISQLKLLGGQAQKISLVFKVIAAWSRNLAGRVHTASNETKEQFPVVAPSAILPTLGLFGPIFAGAVVAITTATIGILAAQQAVESEEAARLQAQNDLADAIRDFNAKHSLNEKAKMIGEIGTNLVAALNGMNDIAESIATFWLHEFNIFTSEGGKMITNLAFLPPFILINVMRTKNIDSWKKIQGAFREYSVVMKRILNLYTFTTYADPLPTTQFHVDELNMDLTVPSEVNVAEIMATN